MAEAHVGSVDIGGAALSVEQRGDGPNAIVFAHGIMLDRRIFESQLAALQDRYRCVAFDFRGHGESEVTLDGYGVDELTDDAATLIERLECAPCCFVGHSLGAFVGLRLAARRPELIGSLVLLAPSADRQPRRDVARYRAMQVMARGIGIAPFAGSLTRTLFGKTYRQNPGNAADLAARRRRIGRLDRRAMVRAVDGLLARGAIHDELTRIHAPTLVVMGDEDGAAPLDLARRVADGIAGARFVMVSAAGHVAPVERPDVVTGLIGDFLAGVGHPAVDDG